MFERQAPAGGDEFQRAGGVALQQTQARAVRVEFGLHARLAAGVDIGLHLPDQFLAREHPARVPNQEVKKLEMAGGDGKFPAVAGQRPVERVEFEVQKTVLDAFSRLHFRHTNKPRWDQTVQYSPIRPQAIQTGTSEPIS